jgi:hypothetical protein
MSDNNGSMVHQTSRATEFLNTFINSPLITLENIERITEFDASSENLDLFAEHILRGAIPIIYANHQSFADGLMLSRVTSAVIKRNGVSSYLKGYLMPSSITAESQPLHQTLLPIYNSRGIFPVGVYTDEEIKDHPEEQRHNRIAALALARGPSENYGLAFFPEASPNGGIKLADGSLRGIQSLEREDLQGYSRIFRKKYPDQSVAFLPIGIDGSHELYDPETNAPSLLAIEALCRHIKHDAFINMTVGKPIDSTEVKGNTNQYLMSAVAQLLPEHSRGAYK